jgi:hypothetical protein
MEGENRGQPVAGDNDPETTGGASKIPQVLGAAVGALLLSARFRDEI